MKKIDWDMLYPDGMKKIKIPRGKRSRDDDQKQLLKFLRKMSPRQPHKKTPRASMGGGGHGKPAPDQRQRATVKLAYSSDKNAHKKFLEEYMTQENKNAVLEKPEIFCGQGSVDGYRERMTGRHFKLIISPESQDVPIETAVRSVMDKMSAELGIKFDWVAAVHNDTGHRHAHVLINGKDMDGNILDKPFPRAFVKHRMRDITREVCTNIVGNRSLREIHAAHKMSLKSSRWTTHDAKILRLAGNQNKIASQAAERDTKKRLDHLAKIGLAKYERGAYTLEKNWAETLRNTGRYNSFLSAREALKWTVPQEMKIWSGNDGTISGTVRKTFRLNDEYTNDNAIVIEGKNGAWFVPLFSPPKDDIEGNSVTITAKQNSRGRMSPTIRVDKNTTGIER